MGSTDDRRWEPANGAGPLRAGVALAEARDDSRPPLAGATTHPDHRAVAVSTDPPPATSPPASVPTSHPWRKALLWAGAVAGLAVGAYFLAPTVKTMLDTVSTDDAYVNGHVTYVAPRVAGQVSHVLVDDNERVNKGDLLVQLDKEPYQVQVDIKKAALVTAEAELMAARSQVRGILAQAGSLRWKLQRSIEDVDDSVALLRARVAALRSKEASFERARADLLRARALFSRNALSREDFDQRLESERTAAAAVKQALEEVHEARVALGLPPHPEKGDLTDVPADINQTFSGVRQALADVNQSLAQLGFPLVSVSLTPQQALEEFTRRDKEGNVDRILERMVPEAPGVRQAEAKRLQAVRDLAQAELDLRYCDIVSEIDGVVSSRSVNPGSHVSAGQSLMAVRSLTEIWVDANFKETQLANLRIGQRVRCEVDMYGGRREFEGRITSFTMGTGQTLSLLPAQNATGNFVKIVQRLPVRVELIDYDPDKAPLFVGLSVTPYVYYKEPATGPHAGDVLRPLRPRPHVSAVSDAAGASRPAAPTPEGRGGA
ncbi:MAG: efflux RND transporter periplasmic adaptor subunit [Isosphaerales bacterium]